MTLSQDLSPIDQLRANLDGGVIAPDDPGYDDARTVFDGGIDRRPAAVVLPTDASEVARVVAIARDSGTPLAVRSGGHSMAGHSVLDDGIVLDLGAMRGLEIDPEARTAWAQAGLTTGEYTKAAAEHGLATGFGDTGSVGVGGITLGGGVGYLSRKFGLTIDELLAAEVVTADGRVLEVDADSHPDLFWAIRGGGGNFGVVTRFKFRLHELSDVVGGMLIFPASPELIEGLVTTAEGAPDEFSAIFNVMTAPPVPFIPEQLHGELVVMSLLCYAGTAEEAEPTVGKLRGLAEPLVDMVRPISYPELFPAEEGGMRPTIVNRNLFLDRVDGEVAKNIFERVSNYDAPVRMTQLRVLGGAIDRVGADETAYAHRGARIMANVGAFYVGPEDKPRREAWVSEYADELRQENQGVYVNFLTEAGPDEVRAAYPGATWDRLRAVKATYDPENIFRSNHNIPPA